MIHISFLYLNIMQLYDICWKNFMIKAVLCKVWCKAIGPEITSSWVRIMLVFGTMHFVWSGKKLSKIVLPPLSCKSGCRWMYKNPRTKWHWWKFYLIILSATENRVYNTCLGPFKWVGLASPFTFTFMRKGPFLVSAPVLEPIRDQQSN